MEDLKMRLEQIASTPRPQPPLDASQAMSRGRRVLLLRRASTLTGGVAATAMVATLAVSGLPSFGGDSSHPGGEVGTGQARPNPLIQRAAFGWLPTGYGVVSAIEDHQGGRDTFELDAGPLDAGPKGARGGVSLDDYGSGPAPAMGKLHGGTPAKRLTAPPVNGHPAYWIAKPGTQDGGRLRWRYGPKNWAELEVAKGPHDKAQTIYQIAKSITFNTSRPTPFPFSVKRLPADLKVFRSILGSGSSLGADVFLAGRGKPEENSLSISLSDARDNRWSRTSEVGPTTGKGKKFAPNTTIDGHSAFDSTLRPPPGGKRTGEYIIVLGVNGFDVRIDATGDVMRQLQASGGVKGIYRRMKVLGTNPANWTTTPLN